MSDGNSWFRLEGNLDAQDGHLPLDQVAHSPILPGLLNTSRDESVTTSLGSLFLKILLHMCAIFPVAVLKNAPQ